MMPYLHSGLLNFVLPDLHKHFSLKASGKCSVFYFLGLPGNRNRDQLLESIWPNDE